MSSGKTVGGEKCLKGNDQELTLSLSCLLKSKWRRQINNGYKCCSSNINNLVVVVVLSIKSVLLEGLNKFIHAVFKTVPGI